MTGPASRLDPATAAALDLYDLPPASPDFAARIAATAATRGRPAAPAASRDRRGPWRRRIMAGGVALLLGTTAAAATLLERAGFHLPAAVALLSPLPRASAPEHHGRVNPAPRRTGAAAQLTPPIRAAAPAPAPAPAPVEVAQPSTPRLALVRARLAALPPPERRAVVRRLIERRLEARAAGGSSDPGLGTSAMLTGRSLDRPWLGAHPAAAAVLRERMTAAGRESGARRLALPASIDVPPRLVDLPDLPLAIPAPVPSASGRAIADPAARQARLDRLRAMRAERAVRRSGRLGRR